MKQKTLAMMNSGFDRHGKSTKRAAFLARMESLVPWTEFCALIEPYYPKAGNGRPPVGLERMLRMYFIANWFNLADEACEDALYDIPALREFCQIDLGRERVPDATTLLGFRHLLEKHDLGSTIIAAPSSTKNQDKARDIEMHQTKKGNEWYFGMKLHIGVDSRSGLIHSSSVTAANVHDSRQLDTLLHGQENRLYVDSAYGGKKEVLRAVAPKARDFTNRRAYRNRPLTEADRLTNIC